MNMNMNMNTKEKHTGGFIEPIFKHIGFLGPYILFVYSLFVLRSKPNYLAIYSIGFVLNFILNTLLKGIIKEPRPSTNKEIIAIMDQAGKYIPFDNYGMPSGHAQMAFFSVAYLYMVTKNVKVLLLSSAIAIITILQRVYTGRHSVLQILVGGVIGSIVGYLFYLYGEKIIKNRQ